MVDEAHERSLSTDVLLGLLKKVQRRRLDLRVIVSSATLQARDVAQFFTSSSASSFAKHHATAAQSPSPATLPTPASRVPALLSVEGRTHAVQVHYLSDPCADYVRAAVEAAVAIHDEQLPGKFLIVGFVVDSVR
jgi:ATP-dependent RNA helicase DDX35